MARNLRLLLAACAVAGILGVALPGAAEAGWRHHEGSIERLEAPHPERGALARLWSLILQFVTTEGASLCGEG